MRGFAFTQRRPRRAGRFGRSSGAAMLVMALTVTGPEAHAQVAAAPAPGLTTTAVADPLALGPSGALLVGGWWRFSARTGSTFVSDRSGNLNPVWPEVDGAVHGAAP